MLQIARVGLATTAFLFVWATILSIAEPGSLRTLVTWFPVLAALAFAAYLFLALVYGVLTFRSVPEESKALQKDILRARTALAAKGVRI